MNNIIDYIKWRGDLSFNADPFNEVDALILARLSYLDLHDIVDESFDTKDILSAQEAFNNSLEGRFIHFEQDIELFNLIAHSKRFGALKLCRYIDHVDKEKSKQFAALTFIIDAKNVYLSFRGTDATFTGWREDLDMTYQEKVPSQNEAIKYLNAATKFMPRADFMLGGHSKGGNLAIAALVLQDNWKAHRKVKAIYSFDGPGFRKEVIVSNAYQEAIAKMTNFIPQSSIFGKMLGHEEKVEIVFSNAIGAYQHDIYSWEVIANHFNHQQALTKSSHIIDEAFDDYLDSLTNDEKAKIVALIFEIIAASQVDTTRDFTKNFFKIAPSVIEKMAGLKPEEKKLLLEAITILKNSFLEAAGSEWEKYAKELFGETETKFNNYVKEKYQYDRTDKAKNAK